MVFAGAGAVGAAFGATSFSVTIRNAAKSPKRRTTTPTVIHGIDDDAGFATAAGAIAAAGADAAGDEGSCDTCVCA